MTLQAWALSVLLMAPLAVQAQGYDLRQRYFSTTVLERAYRAALGAQAYRDSAGVWPSDGWAAPGVRLSRFTMAGDTLVAAFEAEPFTEEVNARSAAYEASRGVVRVPGRSSEVCQSEWEGEIVEGAVEWTGHGRVELAGVKSSLQRCQIR